MIQKCSVLNVLEVFFKEPTTIHFVREIGKKINLAPTSVKNHIKELLKLQLILEKKSNPFDGYIANKENELFLYYKRTYNMYSLYSLKKEIEEKLHPKTIAVFGLYGLGEDTENNNIEMLIVSDTKKGMNLEKFEKSLGRKINLTIVDKLERLDKDTRNKIYNGILLSGGFY